jgi:murein DD-endopeptidase MepM/ murein hydrolase activator NlpD
MGDPQLTSKVVEGDFGTVKVQLAPGGTAAPQRPTRSTQLVWGGDGASAPWGLLKALIEAGGGAVNYTYLHAAALVNARDAGSPDGAKPQIEKDDKPKEASKPDPGSGPLFDDGLDFEFDNPGKKDARVWAHPDAHGAGPRPLVIWLHGILRWDDHPQLSSKLGVDWTLHAGKVAAILIKAKKVTPLVMAAPTSREDKGSSTLWPKFDLGKFVSKVVEQAKAHGVEIDLDQVTVVGHSGAGCYVKYDKKKKEWQYNGLYKIAHEGAAFDGHKLKVLGFADTCVADAFMKHAAADLEEKKNSTTVIYSVHKGSGGGASGVSMDAWSNAMHATRKSKPTVESEADDFRVDDEQNPKRIAVHLPDGPPLWEHEREFSNAGAMKSGWAHRGWGPHYMVCLVWTWYALQRFYPASAHDKAQPAKKAEAPKITGGEWADVPEAPPVWTPPDGAEPKATGSAEFADPVSAVFWPVRTKSQYGRTVCFEKAGGGVVGIPNGKGGSTTQGRHFLAERENGKRYHVGVDLFGDPHDLVVAIESGTILNWHFFYHGVYKLFVQCDSGLVINYGEVDKVSETEFNLKPGKRVVAWQPIARIGRMSGGGHMLHFEMYPNGTKDNQHYYPGNPPSQLRKFKNAAQYLIALARVGK